MPNPREVTEAWERDRFNPRAALAAASKGRETSEPQDDLRTCFQRDRDRIIHSKAFRRLKHKTQVFLAPEGDHYRTRLTHTLEVMQVARTAARALRLNEDLTEAVALAHDLGHPPFGHAGEDALNEMMRPVGGFRHYEQSLRVVHLLEIRTPAGGTSVRGLNLTWEVRDGIGSHSKGLAELPPAEDDRLALNALVDFLTERVYRGPSAVVEVAKAKRLVAALYDYYLGHPDEVSPEYQDLMARGEPARRVIGDFLAGMTDRYAIRLAESLFIPTPGRPEARGPSDQGTKGPRDQEAMEPRAHSAVPWFSGPLVPGFCDRLVPWFLGSLASGGENTRAPSKRHGEVGPWREPGSSDRFTSSCRASTWMSLQPCAITPKQRSVRSRGISTRYRMPRWCSAWSAAAGWAKHRWLRSRYGGTASCCVERTRRPTGTLPSTWW